MLLKMSILILILYVSYLLCIDGALNTFRTEVLNITPPPQVSTILDEAIWLMRRHFLHRNSYKDSDWDELRRKYSAYNDQKVAIKHFMESFGDPYTRYIPEKLMVVRQRSIRGHTLGVGLELKRKFHFKEFGIAVNQYVPRLLSSICNFNNIFNNRFNKPIANQDNAQINNKRHSRIMKIWSKALISIPLLKLIKKREVKGNIDKNNINQISINKSFVTFSEQLQFSVETMVPIVTVFLYSAFNKNAMTLKKKLVIGAASFVIVCISVARRLMPIVYPIEVVGITNNTTSMTSQIQNGDRILSVEQQLTNGWSLKKINAFLEDGNEDDPVTLNILRPDVNMKFKNSSEVVSYTKMDVVVNRKRILSKKVTTTVLPENQGPGLGYLAIEEFTDNTLYEVEKAMDELDKSIFQQQKRHLRALIIDLRGNPGGPLPPALDLAALFLPRGKVITQMGIQGQCEIHKSLNRNPNRSLSLLILADGNTASASEIFIASLQDNARAKCMGTRTVGKNVAQAMMMLSDGSGLAFTVREYHSPKGNSMGNGIKPDIEIHDIINVKDILFDIKNSTWSLKQINYLDIDN